MGGGQLCGKSKIFLATLRSHSTSLRSGHLTGLKRKMPQLGIFPNCYLRSQLLITPMFNSIKFPFPRTIKRGKNPHLALRRMITKSLKTCEHYFIYGMEKFILLVKWLNYWRNRWRYTLFILLYFFIALLF